MPVKLRLEHPGVSNADDVNLDDCAERCSGLQKDEDCAEGGNAMKRPFVLDNQENAKQRHNRLVETVL